MFNLRDFIKRGLLDAVGRMADYKIILNAAGWLEKSVLLEEDLAEIQNRINSRYETIRVKESGIDETHGEEYENTFEEYDFDETPAIADDNNVAVE